MRHRSLISLLLRLLGAAAMTTAPAEARAATAVGPALDGIMEAFASHPAVGLDHGHSDAEEIVRQLIGDPRFAREVGNVVIEGGSSRYQAVVDRYVAGETVPYAELRAAWADAIGPTIAGGSAAGLLQAAREANKALPPDDRVRIWLGEPPLDWSAATRGDVFKAMVDRDGNAARIVGDLLGKGEKALLFYGGFHFIAEPSWLRGKVDEFHPGAFFVVLTYSFIHQPAACAPFRERAAVFWPTPALAAPARPGVPEVEMRECATLDGRDLVKRGLLSLSGGEPPVIRADAVLFFPTTDAAGIAPPAGPADPDPYLDSEHRRELVRRSQLGGPIVPPFPADLVLRKSDYAADLEASGHAELVERMFAEHDRNGDGAVTADEYVDPAPQAGGADLLIAP